MMKRNNVLALALIGVMLFSIMGAITVNMKAKGMDIAIIGFATSVVDAATANKVSIGFTQGEANFGSGYVTKGSTECIIDTEGGKSGCGGFSKPKSLVLKNTGENNAKVSIANTKGSSNMDGASYYLKWSSKDGACTGGNMDAMKAYTELKDPLKLDKNIICGVLKPGEEVKIDLRLKITSKQMSITDSFKAVANSAK
jgi:hypothetical protein